MKKAILFVFSFVFLGFISACGGSSGSSGSKAVLTVYANGKEEKSLRLFSKQVVKLEAVLKDAKGKIVANPKTAWTTDWDGLGNFSDPDKSETSFTAFDGPTTEDNYIIVDCNGLKKKLKVSVDNVSIVIEGTSDVMEAFGSIVKANVTYNGSAYEGDIEWSIRFPSSGLHMDFFKFDPEKTKSGQDTTVEVEKFAPGHDSAKVYIRAKVEDFVAESDLIEFKHLELVP